MVAIVVPEKEELSKRFSGDVSDLCESEVGRLIVKFKIFFFWCSLFGAFI